MRGRTRQLCRAASAPPTRHARGASRWSVSLSVVPEDVEALRAAAGPDVRLEDVDGVEGVEVAVQAAAADRDAAVAAACSAYGILRDRAGLVTPRRVSSRCWPRSGRPPPRCPRSGRGALRQRVEPRQRARASGAARPQCPVPGAGAVVARRARPRPAAQPHRPRGRPRRGRRLRRLAPRAAEALIAWLDARSA